MRDGGRADESTKWGCVLIEQNRAENGALGTPHVREDEGERYNGMETADMRDDKYEVNH